MKYFVLAIFTAFILSGCGGGGGSTPAPDVQTPAPISESDIRVNYALRGMNALYAYENGYHGQSVTVAVSEIINASHEDLNANVLTFSIDYDWKWDRFATVPTLTLTGLTLTIDGEVLNAPTISVSYHGTGSAGMVAAERNGKGSHGVAPQAKLIPLPNASFTGQPLNFSDIEWLAQSTVHIFSRSTYNILQTEEEHSAAQNAYTSLVGKDIVIVQALGNNRNTPDPEHPFLPTGLPALVPELEENFLVVGGLTHDNEIDFFSTRCHGTMMWCVMGYGNNDILTGLSLTSPSGPADNDYQNFGGTSAATPQVAGALAVLKSAMPEMKMTEIRLILLETATDLGEEGVDEVYGWGLVNISAGIVHLQEIKNQMSAIESMGIPRLGGAAAAANSGKFAAAAGEGAFRFWGGLENRSKRAGLATAEYGGISAFGEVGNSALEINSFLANGEVQNAESESWTAGIQRGNIWRHNDNLQISARQESRLSDGELVLQYSFGKQIRIPIKQKPATIWTAAYSQESDNGKWTAAMEWNAATNAKGFSFAAEIDL